MSFSPVECLVQGCPTSIFKPPSVTFHSCPTSSNMRNQWLISLKNKCVELNWSESKICSKHFTQDCFDMHGNLKSNSVPTLFSASNKVLPKLTEAPSPSSINIALSKLSINQLQKDVRSTRSQLQEPINLVEFVNKDLVCDSDSPIEAQLWMLVKKQESLITKLVSQSNKHKLIIESLKNKSVKKDFQKQIDTQKYIIKSLHEKQSTLEEQIEILTAVESR